MAAADQDTHVEVMERSVQDRLVEAAEDLFCRRGYNETSVRDIAASAECNVAAVNYYCPTMGVKPSPSGENFS